MNKVFIFVLGAAVGSLVTWKFVEEKYRRIADEEIESVKETFKNRESKIAEDEKQAEELGVKSPSKEFYNQLKEASDKLTDDVNHYKEIITTSEYSSTDIEPKKNIKDFIYTEVDGEGQIFEVKPKDYPEPYVIAPEEFGEDGYNTESLIYYQDKVLATNDDNMIDADESELLLGDGLEHFGEYEDDAVHVRNEKTKTDYEILRSEKYFFGDVIKEEQ